VRVRCEVTARGYGAASAGSDARAPAVGAAAFQGRASPTPPSPAARHAGGRSPSGFIWHRGARPRPLRRPPSTWARRYRSVALRPGVRHAAALLETLLGAVEAAVVPARALGIAAPLPATLGRARLRPP